MQGQTFRQRSAVFTILQFLIFLASFSYTADAEARLFRRIFGGNRVQSCGGGGCRPAVRPIFRRQAGGCFGTRCRQPVMRCGQGGPCGQPMQRCGQGGPCGQSVQRCSGGSCPQPMQSCGVNGCGIRGPQIGQGGCTSCGVGGLAAGVGSQALHAGAGGAIVNAPGVNPAAAAQPQFTEALASTNESGSREVASAPSELDQSAGQIQECQKQWFNQQANICLRIGEPARDHVVLIDPKTGKFMVDNHPQASVELRADLAQELASKYRALDEKHPSRQHPSMALLLSNYPPAESEKIAKSELVEGDSEKAAFAAYTEYMAKYSEKLKGEQSKEVQSLVSQFRDVAKEVDPKKRRDLLEAKLTKLFNEGLSAPAAEEGTKPWREITGGALTPEQNKAAARHYSAIQIENRREIFSKVASELLKVEPRIADAIGQVARGGAAKAHGILLEDSFKESEPQCASCGGMPRQSEFEEAIQQGIAAVLAEQKPAVVATPKAMPRAAAAVSETATVKPPVFRLGTCYFCKRAAPVYATRVANIRARIASIYPGAKIEEYDAAALGEINKGEIKISENGSQISHAPIRDEGQVGAFLQQLFSKRPANGRR
jgi:hypothetical protein